MYTYEDGNLIKREVYFRTGELRYRVTFDPESGLMQGTECWYYRSGQQMEKTPFVRGYAHGVCKRYSAEGKQLEETLYVESRVVPNEERSKHFAQR